MAWLLWYRSKMGCHWEPQFLSFLGGTNIWRFLSNYTDNMMAKMSHMHLSEHEHKQKCLAPPFLPQPDGRESHPGVTVARRNISIHCSCLQSITSDHFGSLQPISASVDLLSPVLEVLCLAVTNLLGVPQRAAAWQGRVAFSWQRLVMVESLRPRSPRQSRLTLQPRCEGTNVPVTTGTAKIRKEYEALSGETRVKKSDSQSFTKFQNVAFCR